MWKSRSFTNFYFRWAGVLKLTNCFELITAWNWPKMPCLKRIEDLYFLSPVAKGQKCAKGKSSVCPKCFCTLPRGMSNTFLPCIATATFYRLAVGLQYLWTGIHHVIRKSLLDLISFPLCELLSFPLCELQGGLIFVTFCLSVCSVRPSVSSSIAYYSVTYYQILPFNVHFLWLILWAGASL